ncbi:MAG: ABC transporter permease, partial [Polyangiaceae bacterium]|nr:ABC transporter permease [Polyangiaceae bacterium]
MKPKKLGFFQKIARFWAEVRDAVLQAARALVSHTLRAALTITGVSVGIMAVIVIFMVQSGMEASFARQLNSLGPNTLYVHKWVWGVNNRDWWK